MSQLLGALCDLNLRKVIWCQLEPAEVREYISAMRQVSDRSCLCQETSERTGRQKNTSTIGASCHLYLGKVIWC